MAQLRAVRVRLPRAPAVRPLIRRLVDKVRSLPVSGRASVTQVALLVLQAVAGALIVAPLSYALRQAWWPAPCALLALWLLPGAALASDRVRRLAAVRLLGWREASPQEQRVLGPAWAGAVARRGGGCGERRLMVVHSADINAHGFGGSIVAVTTGALERLRPEQLEAVLVHELGHITGVHALLRLLSSQLMIPVRVVAGVVRGLGRLSRAVGLTGVRSRLIAASVVAAPAVEGVRGVMGHRVVWTGLCLVPLLAGAGFGLARLGHMHQEYEADAAATAAGLGPALCEALETILLSEGQPARHRLLDSTRVLIRRIKRLRRLASQGESRAVAIFQQRHGARGARSMPWEKFLLPYPDLVVNLHEASDKGALSQVDHARIRAALHAAAGSPDAMAGAIASLRTKGQAAFLHVSGLRDLPRRECAHDLEAGRVRLGSAPDRSRGTGAVPFSLELTMLCTSMLVVGPPGSGKTRSFAVPTVEHLCLQALANQASVVVIDVKGDDFTGEGMFDIVVDLADPSHSWGFDLYGGAATPEEAADRLASALLPPDISGDHAYFTDSAKNALYRVIAPYHAANQKYPGVRDLIELLRGRPRLLQSTRDKLKSKGLYQDFERILEAREQQLARREDPAASLVERIGLLDRPTIVELLDNKRRRFSMRDINQPLRVRLALPEGIYPDAARILARLAVAQFVQTASSPTANRAVFKGLVMDEAGRYIDDYVARGVQRIRSKNAGLILLTQSLGDFPETLLSTVFSSIGCHAVFAGVNPTDAQYYADYWGMEWREEVTLTTSTGQTSGHTDSYSSRTRGSSGTSLSVHPETTSHGTAFTQGTSVRQVERYRWSPSAIANDVPVGHAVVSLAQPDGTRTPPTLVNLRATVFDDPPTPTTPTPRRLLKRTGRRPRR